MKAPMRINKAYAIGVVALLWITITAPLFAQSPNSLPPAKKAIEQQYTQERAAGTQNPAPRDPNAPYPIITEYPFDIGIFDECDAPFSSEKGHIVNCWQGILSGVKTEVFAGAESADVDQQQGIVYVLRIPDYSSQEETTLVAVSTPVHAGAVRIVAAKNGILTLVSDTGHYVLTFDVSTRQFTSVVVDKTPPVISGMPTAACTLWPPNHNMVNVATVTASDLLSGVAPGTFSVTGTSNELSNPSDPDIVITPNGSGGFSVQLRADRLGTGTGRIYTLTAKATDQVGNTATNTATCKVPHDQSM